MPHLSRALERTKALFSKQAASSRTADPLGPSSPTPSCQPLDAPEALLADARLRRTGGHWPPAVEDDHITGYLERAYVQPEDEDTRRLASPMRRAQ